MTEDFIFDGQKLSDFGYIVCSDGVIDETYDVSILEFVDIKAPLSDTSHKVSSSYSENLSRTIKIMKMNCYGSYEDSFITDNELSEISRWLCRKNYKWFKWVDKKNENDVCYEVKINVRKIVYGLNIIGLELSIQSNRPYGLTHLHDINYVLDSTNNNLGLVVIHSDEEGYIYPDMTIKCLQSGNLKIVNTTTNDEPMIIKNCSEGEIINIYGNDVFQISSSTGHALYKDFNYKYFRLYSDYDINMNTFISLMDCEVAIK